MSNKAIAKIPDINKVREQAVIGAAQSSIAHHKWKMEEMERANCECNENIAKAADRGDKSTSCDTWVSDAYLTALQSKGYETKFVDAYDDGEGGRLSSIDALGSSYYRVSWSK